VDQPKRSYYLRSTSYFPLTLSLLLLGTVYLTLFIDTRGNSRFTFAELGFVLCFLAYSLHKATLSRIEVSRDGKDIVAMPSLLDRRFWGERETSARVTSGAELLFCCRSAYGAFDGYHILLRAPGNSEQILWKESSVTSVSRRYWERIAREIARNNCVSTRLIQQRVTAEGIQETDWTAQSNRVPRKNLQFLIGLAFFPWMGIIARLLTRDVRLIALIGVLLWLVAFFVVRYTYKTRQLSKDEGGFGTGMLVWTLTFVSFYVVTVLVTDAVLSRHYSR